MHDGGYGLYHERRKMKLVEVSNDPKEGPKTISPESIDSNLYERENVAETTMSPGR